MLLSIWFTFWRQLCPSSLFVTNQIHVTVLYGIKDGNHKDAILPIFPTQNYTWQVCNNSHHLMNWFVCIQLWIPKETARAKKHCCWIAAREIESRFSVKAAVRKSWKRRQSQMVSGKGTLMKPIKEINRLGLNFLLDIVLLWQVICICFIMGHSLFWTVYMQNSHGWFNHTKHILD